MSRTCSDAGPDALQAASAILTAQPLTMLIWMRTNDAADNFQSFGGLAQAGTDNFFKYRLRMTSGLVQFQTVNTGARDARSSAGPSVDTWAHVAAREVDASNSDVFLDGGNIGSDTGASVPAGIDTTSIGQLDDGSLSGRFEGELGHASFYDTDLSQGMIETHAAGFNPMRIQRGNLLGYYPCNGQSPEPNVMGGVDLALVGAPPVAPNPPIRHFNVAPA